VPRKDPQPGETALGAAGPWPRQREDAGLAVRTLADLFATAARTHASRLAIVAAGERLTWGELGTAAAGLAAALVAQGVTRGDRVVLQLDNGWRLAAAIGAVALADAVLVIVDPRLPPERLAFIVADCGARAFIADAGRAAHAQAARAAHAQAARAAHAQAARAAHAAPIACFMPAPAPGIDLESAFAGRCGSEPPPSRSISVDLAALIYTSGSTGQPKGVMHSHQTMLFALTSLLDYLPIGSGDRILCPLPLAFDYGLYQYLMAAATGATLVLDGASAFIGDLVAALRRADISVFPGVPTLYAMLARAHARQRLEIPSVRLLTSTAADLSPALHAPLQAIFPNAALIRMYGLTECKRVSWLPPALLESRPHSVGIPIPGTEALVCDEAGREVPAGQPGILHVRGGHVMLGYWNRPEETARMLKAGPSGDRILVTGDLFERDSDGFLRFLGRTDDMLKSRGEKVAPLEVESALLAISGVAEAAVVGAPDPVLGDAIVAFVTGSVTDERALRRALAGRLSPHLVPGRIILVDALPRTSNGKIDKQALAAAARDDAPPA
jgi:long-chain acyl-CoA synthetase